MRRADRLFQIIQFLRGGRLLTAGQIAEKLEVSKRTIYRDMADLIGSGVPIDGEAGMGYVLSKDYDMPPLAFTSEEIVAIVAGARLIRAFGGEQMAYAAEEALTKIEAVLPEEARSRAAHVNIHAIAPFLMEPQTRRFLDQIEWAETNQLRLEIEYQDEVNHITKRLVQPLGLFFWGKVWTLVAWCELREDFRMFRVDRMADLEVMDRFARAPERSLRAYFLRNENCMNCD